MLKVGITGGIGSGKTVVCQIFQALEIPIYNADNRAKAVMEEDAELVASITSVFGNDAYSKGKLNREYLAQKVFNNQLLLNQLNAVVHPCVARDFSEWVAKNKTHPFILKEAALLVETGSYKQLDALIVVTCPMETRISRIKKRDPFRSESQIQEIIKKQLPEEAKTDRADYLIRNDDKLSLIHQVREIFLQLKNKAALEA